MCLSADLHTISTEPVYRDFTKQVRKQSHQQRALTMSMIDNRSFQDTDIFLFAQGFKVVQRAQVDVRCVEPLIGQGPGDWYDAANSELKPAAVEHRISADPQASGQGATCS